MPTEAELLADLLEGKVDATDVPAELAELASLAERVSQHITLVPPTDAFRESLREEVLQTAGSVGGAGGAGGAGASTSGAVGTAATTGTGGLSAIIAGVAATAVLATSVVAAADRAGPGDLLAGVDRGVESLQLAIADQEREAELLVDFAAERVLEAVDLVDVAVVTEQLQRAKGLLDQALALGVEQGRDLQELTEPYVAALLTLASRTDDPGVQAQIQQLLDEAGVDTTTSLVPGRDGGEPPVGDDSDSGDDGETTDATDSTDSSDSTDSAGTDGDSSDDGLLDDSTDELDDTVQDTTDELDDTVEDLDDTVEDPVDELDDTVQDPVDELDDTVDESVDDLDDTVQDTSDDLLGD